MKNKIMYKHFKFKKFMKKSGMLIPIELNKKFPIKIKRIFIIYGKKNYIRAQLTKNVHSFLFQYLAKLN